MKRTVLAALTALTCANSALAAPAVPGTLADFIALGSGGATIGSTLFSDFMLLPLQVGAVAISPSSILVNPINLFNNPGFEFVLSSTAAAGSLLELNLSFKVTNTAISGASVALGGSSVVVDGANTATLDLTGPLPPVTLIAFDLGVVSDNPVSGAFGAVPTLTAELDAVVDGGVAGGAGLNSVTTQFVVAGAPGGAAIPEPGTALAGLAALAFCGTARRRNRSTV